MAKELLRGRAATAPAVSEPLPIGQEDHQIFNCPVCARPLTRGSRRCPGCQTRLVGGVPASKASLFVVTGLVAGLLVGGAGTAGILAASSVLAPSTPAGQAAPSGAPGTAANSPTPSSPSASASPSGSVYLSGIVSSSLKQAAEVNVSLAESSIALHAQLDSSTFDTQETAVILRSIASSAQFGSEVAPRIGTWEAASDLSLELVAFYDSVRGTARDGLGISLTSTNGYRQAAKDMIGTLRQLRSLQATATKLGTTANLELPALPSAP